MIDFEALSAAMGDLDEDTVKELLEAVDSPEAADKAMEACQTSAGYKVLNEATRARAGRWMGG